MCKRRACVRTSERKDFGFSDVLRKRQRGTQRQLPLLLGCACNIYACRAPDTTACALIKTPRSLTCCGDRVHRRIEPGCAYRTRDGKRRAGAKSGRGTKKNLGVNSRQEREKQAQASAHPIFSSQPPVQHALQGRARGRREGSGWAGAHSRRKQHCTHKSSSATASRLKLLNRNSSLYSSLSISSRRTQLWAPPLKIGWAICWFGVKIGALTFSVHMMGGSVFLMQLERRGEMKNNELPFVRMRVSQIHASTIVVWALRKMSEILANSARFVLVCRFSGFRPGLLVEREVYSPMKESGAGVYSARLVS